MSAYQALTAARASEPDPTTLLASLRALDPTAGVQHTAGSAYVIKKATAWTPGQVSAAQTVLDSAPAMTPALSAQGAADHWPLELQAAFLLVLDRFNLIGTKLAPPLAAVTPAQFLQAIRDKAGTL